MKTFKWPYLLLIVFFAALDVQAKPWKGAEMITRETYKYGAFEARVRSANGSGMVTAFFLWKDGSEIPGAQWQEQDFEMFGKNGKYQTQVMTPGNPRTENAVILPLSAPATEHYFTYRMEWTPTYLAFYVDGHLVRRETDPVVYAKLLDPARAEPAQLRMSLWAGDWSWSGAFAASAVPAHTYVEFIQVYNYTPGAGADGSDFTPRWRDEFDSPNINTNLWWFANWTFEYAVNDYVPRNAAIRNGKLVLALTDEATSGQFPLTAPDDNPPLPPLLDPPPPNYEPIPLPARIEAENFSDYYEITPQTKGNIACMNSAYSVDTEVTGDTSGVCNLSYTSVGEWVEYKVNAPVDSAYILKVRAATNQTGTMQFHVEVDGVMLAYPITVPRKGWQVYSDVAVPVPLILDEGDHVVRLVFDTGNINVNYLQFDETVIVPAGEPIPIPARIEAEDFVAAYDTTAGNSGAAQCDTGDVDSELTNDSAGICNIGNTAAGEWTEYDIRTTGGAFAIAVRAATASNNVRLRVLIDGLDISGALTVPKKGWQVYSNLTVPIELPAGTYRVRLLYETGLANINFITFTAMASSSSAGSSSVASSSAVASSVGVASSAPSSQSSIASSAASSIASSSLSSAASSLVSSSTSSAISSAASSSFSSTTSSVVSSSLSSAASSIASSSSSSAISSDAANASSSVASSLESSSSLSSALSSASSSLASSSISSAVSSSASSAVSSIASSIASSSSSIALSSVASSLGSSVASSLVSSSHSSALSSFASSSRSSAVSSLASSSYSSALSSAASSVASSTASSVASTGNCSYAIVSNWGSGFTGSIRITNKGTSAINGWQLTWQYTGSTRVIASWGGNVTGSNPYVATNMGWNGSIQPGQFVELGFQGTHSGTPEIPVVSGAACN